VVGWRVSPRITQV